MKTALQKAAVGAARNPRCIQLAEHSVRIERLDETTVTRLRTHHRKHLRVVPTGKAGWYRLRATHYVGVIGSPDEGVEIHITPKIPTENLLYMISHAYELVSLRPESALLQTSDNLNELLVAALLGQVERLVRRGLRRTYVEQQRRLSTVRGKLLVSRIRLPLLAGDLSLPCQYESFTEDNEDNQIIRFTLEQLRQSPALTDRMRLRLHKLRAAFSDVRPERYQPADVEQRHYDRLNDHYEQSHKLAALVLAALGVDHARGDVAIPAFLIDMNALFERFVARWIAASVNLPKGLDVQSQHTCYLDEGSLVRLRPDIVLSKALSKQPLLAADTKYKRTSNRKKAGRIRNADVYQALAYTRGLNVETCYLIYPDWKGAPETVVTIDGENTVICDGIQLTGSVAELEASLSQLFHRMQSCLD